MNRVRRRRSGSQFAPGSSGMGPVCPRCIVLGDFIRQGYKMESWGSRSQSRFFVTPVPVLGSKRKAVQNTFLVAAAAKDHHGGYQGPGVFGILLPSCFSIPKSRGLEARVGLAQS